MAINLLQSESTKGKMLNNFLLKSVNLVIYLLNETKIYGVWTKDFKWGVCSVRGSPIKPSLPMLWFQSRFLFNLRAKFFHCIGQRKWRHWGLEPALLTYASGSTYVNCCVMAAEEDVIFGKLHLASTWVEPMKVAHNLMSIVWPRPQAVTSYRSPQTESEIKLNF